MKALDGIFVQASEEQLAEIWEACAAHGFPLDQKGILSLIMLAIHGDPDDDEIEEVDEAIPNVMDQVFNHFASNPAQAEALRNAGAKFFQKIFKKPL